MTTPPHSLAAPVPQHASSSQIGGMTCASCAARIEKKLNRIDGVAASVNYATEKAHVTAPAGLDPQVLIDEVEKTGYTAALPARRHPRTTHDHDRRPRARLGLRQRLIGSIVLSVPVILLAMIPALQFTVLAVGVARARGAGRGVGRVAVPPAAWINLRHGAATMDTLISIGVSAAFLWSLYALFFGHAGMPGMTHDFEWTVQPSDGAGEHLPRGRRGVTMFVLAGRYFEVRSKRRAGAALRALLELGAKDVAVLRADRGRRASSRRAFPVAQLRVGDEFVVRPGEKIADRRRRRLGHVGRRRVTGDGRVGARRGRPRRPRGRRDRQRRRPARRPRDARRRRHAARADGAARRSRRSPARRTCSDSPTASRASSCRSCSSSPS